MVDTCTKQPHFPPTALHSETDNAIISWTVGRGQAEEEVVLPTFNVGRHRPSNMSTYFMTSSLT